MFKSLEDSRTEKNPFTPNLNQIKDQVEDARYLIARILIKPETKTVKFFAIGHGDKGFAFNLNRETISKINKALSNAIDKGLPIYVNTSGDEKVLEVPEEKVDPETGDITFSLGGKKVCKPILNLWERDSDMKMTRLTGYKRNKPFKSKFPEKLVIDEGSQETVEEDYLPF